MKKFLSLALALVMTMSLVTVSAGAKDFTDSKKITYSEAVDVVSAVKVVDGYTDGSFNPTATLTRGAAAKIICNLILGPTTAAELSADTAPYKDVPANHVFAGYIAFCQQQGIISGYADGSFRPAGTLTSYAFMKMLLGALGYDASIEGYVGNNWSIQVAKRALQIGLDDGLTTEFVGTKPVTREEACLYAFNTLQADMVDYSDRGSNIIVGGVTIETAPSKAEAVTLPKESKKDTLKNDEILQFAEKYFTELEKLGGESDAFGRPATIWYVDDEKVGTYAETPDAVYTTTVEKGDLYKDLGKFDKPMAIVVDGMPLMTEAKDKTPVTFTPARGVSDELDQSGNGVLVEAYKGAKDKDGNYPNAKLIVVNTYVGEILDVVDATKRADAYVDIKALQENAPAGKFDTEAFELDEIVLYTASTKDGEKYTIESVVSAETVSGEITKYVAGETYTIAGETYEQAKNAGFDSVVTGVEYVVYLDSYGYMVYRDNVESLLKDMKYVLAIAEDKADKDIWGADGDSTYFARVLSMDGTFSEVKLSLTDKEKEAFSTYQSDYQNKFVTVKTDKDGNVSLKALKGETYANAEGGTFANETKVVENGKVIDNQKFSYNNATIFMLYSAKDKVAKVYTGFKAVPTVTVDNAKGMAYDTLNKKGTAAVVVLWTDDAIKGSSSDNVMYVLGETMKEVHDGEDVYYQYTAVVNGEKQTVKFDADQGGANFVAKEYTVEDGVITKVTPITSANAKDNDVLLNADITAEYGDEVIGIGNKSYLASETVKVVKITGKDEVSTMNLAAVREKDGVYTDVTVVLNDDADTVEYMFVCAE